MSEYREEALKKLKEGSAQGHYDRYAQAMKQEVLRQMEDFCRQDEEFAQAVVQGGSFEDCMKAVAKGIHSSLSDLEAYRRAVQFWFPGAEVRMQLTVDLAGAAGETETEEKPETPAGIVLDFTQFL